MQLLREIERVLYALIVGQTGIVSQFIEGHFFSAYEGIASADKNMGTGSEKRLEDQLLIL